MVICISTTLVYFYIAQDIGGGGGFAVLHLGIIRLDMGWCNIISEEILYILAPIYV